MSNTRYKLSVMQAALEGKPIQFRRRRSLDWQDVEDEPVWDWWNMLYRVKPQECWLVWCEGDLFGAFTKEWAAKDQAANLEGRTLVQRVERET